MSSFNFSPHDGHSPQSFAQERWTDDQIQHGKTRAARKSPGTVHCISDIRRYLCRAEADIPEASHALLDNLRVQLISLMDAHDQRFLWHKCHIYYRQDRQKRKQMIERERERVRTAMRCRFFQIAPAGQDHFKQSTTRLYFIADKIIEMTMEMYHQPRAMVEADSAVAWASASKDDSIKCNVWQLKVTLNMQATECGSSFK